MGVAVAMLTWASARAESVYANKCAAFMYLTYSGEVMGDAPHTTSHKSVNCFAWQQFIALNWPASGQHFGESGDRAPVQWQTFPAQADVFLPHGDRPVPGKRAPLPAACAARVGAMGKVRSDDLTVLQAPAGPGQVPTRINAALQAGAEETQASWLGASNDTNVWYEIRVNQELTDYIVANNLYHARGQEDFVAAGHPVVLPKGSGGGPVGTIEVKAAWMEMPDPQNPKWSYFKTSDAAILNAAGTDCRLTPVALIGLHIIQKTRTQPTFFWATFEHMDNVPDEKGPVSGSFNLYNSRCRPQTVQVDDPHCLAGSDAGAAPTTVTVGCSPNVRPAYHLGESCPAPKAVQTSRVVPIQQDVVDANRMVQASIAKNHPDSVWQYYKLINVQWSPNPVADADAPRPIPARLMPTFPALPVANTSMETYLQTTTCTVCHVNGALAGPANISSDFSFVFQAADH